MNWWGKLVGGGVGYLIGGPIGALIGTALGHYFDQGLKSIEDFVESGEAFGKQERIQTAFFTALFSIMGHLAKADGRVSQSEIDFASQVMDEMQLSADQRKVAIDLFQQGKAIDFPVEEVMEQFRQECYRRPSLIQMFLEILISVAHADGEIHENERDLLVYIGSGLGITPERMESLLRMGRAHYYHEHPAPSRDSLNDAYNTLGLTRDAGNDEIKKAYRRLMNQHHPDKLVAKGLPEEMMKIATEKTQEIKEAYELIRKKRNIK